jgi:hypothetical protein
MAVVQQQLGNLPEAIKTSQTCLNLCRQLKDQSGEVQIQHNLALLVYQ